MAYNTYLRLANTGINIDWYTENGKRIKKYDVEFRQFASRIGKTNASGLDGIIDELHGSAIARGGMGFEIVIESLKVGIEDVYLVDPDTIKQWKWLPDKKRYAAYQYDSYGNKVDLFEGNFFYVPFQPQLGKPQGTLMFEPAINAISSQLSFMQDSLHVLHRIGTPRYQITIDSERIIQSYKNKSTEEIQKIIESEINNITSRLRTIGSANDFVTSDSIKVNVIGGGMNGTGLDIRAWNDVIDVQVMNAFQILQVLMNRLKSGSYALSSVEFKIVADTIESMRRGSKRLIEELCKMWARVNGYKIYAKVEFNPIEWQKMIEKLECELKRLELNRRGEEYGYISKDDAAIDSFGVEGAFRQEEDKLFEYVSHKVDIASTETSNDTEDSLEDVVDTTSNSGDETTDDPTAEQENS